MFDVSYEGSEEHLIYSSDHQLLRVQASAYVRFPYNDAPALVKMVRASVPLKEEKLKEWMKEEVLRVVRQVMSKRGFKVAIEGSESDQITIEANTEFSKPNGLLVRSGVYGTNITNISEGEGEVLLKIGQILLSKPLQQQLEDVEGAKLESTAADSRAQVTAKQAGGPIDILMAKWIRKQAKDLGCSVKEAKEKAHANGSWDRQLVTYKDFILAGEDQLEVTRYEIGGPDGSPISGELPGLAALGAIFGGRGSGKNFSKQRNRGKGSDGEEEKGEKFSRGQREKNEILEEQIRQMKGRGKS
jgi:DNA-binding transcriptional MerR regulator